MKVSTVAVTLATLASAVHALPSTALVPRNNDGKSKIPDLLHATLDELADGLSAGLFNSTQLVQAYLARIEQSQPILRAVIETNPYALEEADKADVARKSGKQGKSPLFGLPILVKDNIANARPDQSYMNTTAGSFALLGSGEHWATPRNRRPFFWLTSLLFAMPVPPEDATMIAKLKKAGAIILGKSNLSQWANYRSSNSSNGWSAVGGQVTAAYYPNQVRMEEAV